MKFHELANIFPLLSEEELAELRADIEKNGLTDPITLYEGKVLDGRNRATACEMAGITPTTIEYTGDDPVAFVLSKNIHRRHLTESQRAMAAEKLANIQQGGHKKVKPANLPVSEGQGNQGVTTQDCAVSQREAAKMLNVSERQVRNAAKLRREASPEAIKQVERGEKTIHAALPKRTSPKPQPRRKTVAKEPEPKREQTEHERHAAQEVKLMSDWWEKMPKAYRQLTNGGELTGCMQVPVPFHHNVMMEMFRKMCDD